MNTTFVGSSQFSRSAALRKKESLREKVTPKQYTLWSALATAAVRPSDDSVAAPPPFINLANGEEVNIEDFRKRIAAVCILFLDLSQECITARQIAKDYLKKMDDLEVPARTIVIPVQQQSKSHQPSLTQEEYETVIDGLPGGLVLPSAEDPRAHILASFRQDFQTIPVLATFDSAGNRLNANAFNEMVDDLNNDLRNFPYRTIGSSSSSSLVRLFRSEFVDPELLDSPCVCLHRLSSSASDEVHSVSLLFANAAKRYREARGESSRLKFFETRTLDQVTFVRDADKCRLGHTLARRGAFDNQTCNGCESKGTCFMGCAPCGFDLCPKCCEDKVQIPHPDVLLMAMLCDEFSRDAPRSLCCIAWDYKTGAFGAVGPIRDDNELYSFFQKFDR